MKLNTIMEKTYYEIHLPTTGFDTDILSGHLHGAGCMGIYEQSDAEWLVYLPGDWTPEHHRTLFAQLSLMNPGFVTESVVVDRLPYRDWNEEWQKFFKPIPIGEKIWVRPPWEQLPENISDVAVIIDPQMAFGTGHHETTRLMVQAVQRLPLAGKNVLDLGTGSGILAIVARMYGADEVTAIDIDPDAIDNAIHNLDLNAVTGVEVMAGNISCAVGRQFPVILANLQFHILAPIGDALYQNLEDGGQLIVSGILADEADRFADAYRHIGFKLKYREVLGEWAALAFGK